MTAFRKPTVSLPAFARSESAAVQVALEGALFFRRRKLKRSAGARGRVRGFLRDERVWWFRVHRPCLGFGR